MLSGTGKLLGQVPAFFLHYKFYKRLVLRSHRLVIGINYQNTLELIVSLEFWRSLNGANMSDRKAELERKKQKLEMMRKERQEKERLKKMKEVTLHTRTLSRTYPCLPMKLSVFYLIWSEYLCFAILIILNAKQQTSGVALILTVVAPKFRECDILLPTRQILV